MNKYIIALDMDGTLLTSNQTISNKTVEILKKLKEMGHKIVITSGRPLRSILPYYNLLELDTPIIGYNGGAIFAGNSDFKPYSIKFSIEEIKNVLNEVGIDKIINYMCESDNKIYLLKNDDTFSKWFSYNGLKHMIGDLRSTLDEAPYTMIYKMENENLHLLKEATEKLKTKAQIRFWSGGSYAEFYYEEITKFYGIKKIAEYYNIPLTKIIAFGDAANDIPMMENVGISVAMKNASNVLKTKCNFITSNDNNNDGIAHFLIDYFNL